MKGGPGGVVPGPAGRTRVSGVEGGRDFPELVLDVGLAALEREPAALRLLHDADLDAVDRRQALAAHPVGDLLEARVVAGVEVPGHAAVAAIRGEHDLRRT